MQNSEPQKPTALQSKNHIPKKELWLFSVSALGQAMIYGIMSNYISDYYLNVLLLSPWYVLFLMLFARVWDAINDPLMGIIADKYSFKKSKYKPYILISVVPIAILTFFMFYNPGIENETSLMVFCGFIYIFWGMTYTMADVPFWSLPNVMTPNPEERGKTFSLARTLNGIGGALPILAYLLLGIILKNTMKDATDLERDKTSYMLIAIIMSVVGGALYCISYFTTKERVKIPKVEKTVAENGGKKQSMLKRLFTCKPLMLVVIMGVLSFGRYLMQAAAPHVSRYAFLIDDLSLFGSTIPGKTIVNAVVVASAAIGMFGSMLCLPALYKKFDYKKIIIVSCLLGFASSVLTTVFCALIVYKHISWLFYVCIPFFILQSIPLGVLNVTSYAMIGDCLDYMEYTTGYRDNALGSAVQGFVNKIGNCFATCFVIIMYLVVGLDVSTTVQAEDVATVLTTGQQFGMSLLVSLVPGVCLLLCSIPIFFYDLSGEKKEKMERELAERRAAAEEQ